MSWYSGLLQDQAEKRPCLESNLVLRERDEHDDD